MFSIPSLHLQCLQHLQRQKIKQKLIFQPIKVSLVFSVSLVLSIFSVPSVSSILSCGRRWAIIYCLFSVLSIFRLPLRCQSASCTSIGIQQYSLYYNAWKTIWRDRAIVREPYSIAPTLPFCGDQPLPNAFLLLSQLDHSRWGWTINCCFFVPSRGILFCQKNGNK